MNQIRVKVKETRFSNAKNRKKKNIYQESFYWEFTVFESYIITYLLCDVIFLYHKYDEHDTFFLFSVWKKAAISNDDNVQVEGQGSIRC
jgi:hypothetical protein